jgi:tight adherence protein B
MLILTLLIIVAAITLLTMALAPLFISRAKMIHEQKQKEASKEVDKMFYEMSHKQVLRLYYIAPVICGAIAFAASKSFLFALLGGVMGLAFIPRMILRMREKRRKKQFDRQVLDVVMLLSSCLKGGLSFQQSIEVIVEEMPPPAQQEYGLVLKENKMGKTMDQALENLLNRMYSSDLELVVNSILVAKETGGDLTKVLARLSTTIRDNRKVKENIETLTLQGRLQGVIMSFLPLVFVYWVWQQNPHHFDIMFRSEMGRMLLVAAIILQLLGMILIRKFSSINL